MMHKRKDKKNKPDLSLDFTYYGGALSKQRKAKASFSFRHPHPHYSPFLFRFQKHSENQVMGSLTVNPLFRSESFGYYHCYYPEQNYTMIEKRQLFLRSYQFCRKKSLTERIKGSVIGAKKVVWLRLRSARRLVFSRFKCAFSSRRRRFSRLLNRKSDSSSCFW